LSARISLKSPIPKCNIRIELEFGGVNVQRSYRNLVVEIRPVNNLAAHYVVVYGGEVRGYWLVGVVYFARTNAMDDIVGQVVSE